MIAFVSKIRRKRFELGDILWKVYYQKDFINGQSLIIFNIHHIITDGMGLASLISSLDSKNTPEAMPKMRKSRLL